MLRITLATLCIFSGILLSNSALATGGDPDASPGDDIHQLRVMIEQQSKQLDVMAQEIARLNLLLEAKNPALSPIPAAPLPAASTETASPAAPIPKAAPVTTMASTPAGPVHIVSKGETLTAIAKRYKVTVPDILKVNKITDARKLQIGQTLVLPPGAKIPESPTPAPAQP
ncbi:MAG TPA: LysM domain-containing protein [Chthoniobacteraceae bacterium]|jgi:LysM repeat protein|nr:LysM domain-containing protein [Chthoniobacteraceae bacterium]